MQDFEIPDKYKVRTPTVKYEKTKKAPKHPQYSSVDETNALMNWQKKMFERKKQQGYISSKNIKISLIYLILTHKIYNLS